MDKNRRVFLIDSAAGALALSTFSLPIGKAAHAQAESSTPVSPPAASKPVTTAKGSKSTRLRRLRPTEDFRSPALGFQSLTTIKYTGTWTTSNVALDIVRRSNTQFSAFELCFGGPGIRWIGGKGPAHGFADIYLDNVFIETIDAYAAQEQRGQVKFERLDLDPNVPHKLRVVVSKQRNPAATDCFQDLEGLEAQRPYCYAAVIAEKREAEYAIIRGSGKPVPNSAEWQRVQPVTKSPAKGVKLSAGPLRQAFDRNIAYLRHCIDSPTLCDGAGWGEWLPGAQEGRIVAGIANILRWEEHADLRDGLVRIVDKIRSRARTDGYFGYYPEEESFELLTGMDSERKNYDRVFWTRGLLAAGALGIPNAYNTARAMYDWFNASPFLPNMLVGSNATNGFPGGPLMYHSPVGKPDDLVTNIRYYDQDFWIEELSRAEPLAFTYYPGERPHCYDLLGLEAFIDQYRATGAKKYLSAVLGGWKAYRDNFKHVGGFTTLMESYPICPPRNFFIKQTHVGELCGSAFWITVNQKLLELFPTTEAYAAEIEETLLNGVLGAQDARGYLRYHAYLSGKKQIPRCSGTCCEVTGVDMIARSPELIFSLGANEVFVHQFFAGTLAKSERGAPLSLRMETDFPVSGKVRFTVDDAGALPLTLNIRIPGWSAGEVVLRINGKKAEVGKPGSYAKLRRRWKDGDVVTFDLQPQLRTVIYEGVEQAPDNLDRAALMYGPVVLALTGHTEDSPGLPAGIEQLMTKIRRISEDSLAFEFIGRPELRYLPFASIQDEILEMYPVLDPQNSGRKITVDLVEKTPAA